MLIAVITGKSQIEIEEQIKKAMGKADALEFRWDCFDQDIVPFKPSLPVIYTFRAKPSGNEEERLEKLLYLASFNPDYMDLEESIPVSFTHQLKKQHPKIKIILSYHDFKETPKDLGKILLRMKSHLCDFYKLAFFAHSTLDALDILHFQKSHENVIAISMGEHGRLTRILHPWTYASIDTPTAPGQLSLEELVPTYPFTSSKTNYYGLIGDPVVESISHITHNAFFKKQQINAAYVKMPLKKKELQDFFQKIKGLNFKGLSVTTPLKEAIIPFLDALDEKASIIGAVNTITLHHNKWIGTNTDAEGALLALGEKTSVKNKKILILGAGGTAKAIAYEALKKGALVTILNRDEKKAFRLAEKLNCNAGSLNDMSKYFEAGYDILINATTHPLPIDPSFILQGCIAMEVKTTPQWSLFLLEALKKNCTPIFGHRLFLHQALGQFRTWGLSD